MNENNEMLFSQLADGELPSDQTNALLMDMLDDADQRETLKEQLRMRMATEDWRSRGPSRPVVVVAQRPRSARASRPLWRASGLAIAACMGGALVLAGIWAAGGLGRPSQDRPVAGFPAAPGAATLVTAEQMQQVAKVFALHESVAGPLAWYASDDQNTRLASARGAEASQQPIGVLLKVASATPGAPARTLVIVCRNDQPAVIELPAEAGERSALRVYLTPRTVNGNVDVQYAITADGQSQQAPLASLSGQRRLGLAESSLGQLAMGDRVLNVEAAAWPMRQEHK